MGWIGNAAHMAECSDHNADARGLVHALDAMTLNVANQRTIVLWCLAHPQDLEFVINQRTIWALNAAGQLVPHKYLGKDPHTNHVHISGRHGSVGRNSHTCVGYSLAAEAMTPEGIAMPLTDADKKYLDAKFAAIKFPTLAQIATAVWTAKLPNGVVSTATNKVLSMAQDFLANIHKVNYANNLALGQPASVWPQPAKPAVPPIAEASAEATAAILKAPTA